MVAKQPRMRGKEIIPCGLKGVDPHGEFDIFCYSVEPIVEFSGNSELLPLRGKMHTLQFPTEKQSFRMEVKFISSLR